MNNNKDSIYSDKDLVGCPICRGKKTLAGLGSFSVDCAECKGVGWVVSVPKNLEDNFLKSETNPAPNPIPKKKMGRPKKVRCDG